MRRLLFCAVVAACSSSSPAPKAPVAVKAPVPSPAPPQTPAPAAPAAPPAFEQLADATCVVAEAGTAADDIQLRFHGQRFAVIDTPGTFELRANDVAATMHVVTNDVDLTGEVNVYDVAMRPREPRLQDGWFEIRVASVSRVTGDQVRLDLYVPASVKVDPGPPRTFACSNVALSELPRPKFDGTRRMLRAGRKIALHMKPKPPSFGTIEFPLPEKSVAGLDELAKLDELFAFADRQVAVLAKQGSWSKIRLDDQAVAIEAWVKTRELEPASADQLVALASSMKLRGPTTPPVRCVRPVPVYVRWQGEVASVGVMRPNAEIRRESVDGDEIPIFLGGYQSFGTEIVEDTVTPFVRATDLADCEA